MGSLSEGANLEFPSGILWRSSSTSTDDLGFTAPPERDPYGVSTLVVPVKPSHYQSLVFVPQASKIHKAYITKIKEKKAATSALLIQLDIRTTPTIYTYLRPTAENYKHPCFETPLIPIYSTNES